LNEDQRKHKREDGTVVKKRVKRAPQKDGIENLRLTTVEPLTYAQRQFFESFGRGYHIVAEGVAGSGKSYVSTYLALQELFAKRVERIIFLRSIVATRDIGFLPGSILEKSQPYWALYKDHVDELCGNGTAWDILSKKGLVEFESTSFVRGKTWNNAVVIMDEIQNHTKHELYSSLTRIGKNSRVIVCGDSKQSDLSKRDTGWEYLKVLVGKTHDLFDTVTFTNNDIVRSDFVKQIIIADGEIQ